VKTIFISRALDSDSPIRKVSEDQEVAVVDESLITFTKVSWEVPDTTWLFFYSKTGVRMFNEVCPSHHYKILTYGQATAKLHAQYGAVEAHAAASTDKALELLDIHDCKEDITFVCGRQSLRSVHHHPSLKDLHLRECIIYDQSLREGIPSAKYDLAILTSPLNFEAFAKAGRSATTYIAIGATTAAALQSKGVESIIADSPSEEGISSSLSKWLAR